MSEQAPIAGAWNWQRQAAIATMAVAMGLLVIGVMMVLRRDPVRQPLALDTASGWTEVAWSLSPTPWWPSKAFVCTSATCGGEMTLYLRVKVGFCNCADGIADDAELERIGDFAELSRLHEAVDEGQPIVINGLKGRSRPYRMLELGTSGKRMGATVVGLNSGCDAVVATGVRQDDERGDLKIAEAAIAAFIARPPIRQWTRMALGL